MTTNPPRSGETVDVLRRAAALMRSRAEAATDEHRVGQTLLRGVIRCSCGASSMGEPDWGRKHLANLPWQVSRDYATQVWDERERLVASAEGLAEAAHIAAADPPFMLAVADWLDEEVAAVEFDGGRPDLLSSGALAVARAYLKDDQ